MSDKIPSRSRHEETVSTFPKAEQDVPASPKDSLNENAIKLHQEHQDYQHKFPSSGKKKS